MMTPEQMWTEIVDAICNIGSLPTHVIERLWTELAICSHLARIEGDEDFYDFIEAMRADCEHEIAYRLRECVL